MDSKNRLPQWSGSVAGRTDKSVLKTDEGRWV
jgi:hypothetical protein